MADLFLGVNVGGCTTDDVSSASSTTSRPIELRVAVAATPLATRQAVLDALEAIRNHLQSATYSP